MSSDQHNGDTNGQTNGNVPANGRRTLTAVQQARSAWLPERPRIQLMTEDDAGTTLSLGEFTTVPTLSISEARILVEAVHARRHMVGKRWTSTEITHRMLGYMDTFARYNTEDQIKAVDSSMRPFEQLTMFERSQLMNLLPGDADEAKSLIPSLQTKVADGELTDLVQDLTNERNL